MRGKICWKMCRIRSVAVKCCLRDSIRNSNAWHGICHGSSYDVFVVPSLCSLEKLIMCVHKTINHPVFCVCDLVLWMDLSHKQISFILNSCGLGKVSKFLASNVNGCIIIVRVTIAVIYWYGDVRCCCGKTSAQSKDQCHKCLRLLLI